MGGALYEVQRLLRKVKDSQSGLEGVQTVEPILIRSALESKLLESVSPSVLFFALILAQGTMLDTL